MGDRRCSSLSRTSASRCPARPCSSRAPSSRGPAAQHRRGRRGRLPRRRGRRQHRVRDRAVRRARPGGALGQVRLPDPGTARQGGGASSSRHGGKIIAIARFIEGLRQANGIIAGISEMHWLRFVAFNALGAALWVGTWVSVGYFAGQHITGDLQRHHAVLPVRGDRGGGAHRRLDRVAAQAPPDLAAAARRAAARRGPGHEAAPRRPSPRTPPRPRPRKKTLGKQQAAVPPRTRPGAGSRRAEKEAAGGKQAPSRVRASGVDHGPDGPAERDGLGDQGVAGGGGEGRTGEGGWGCPPGSGITGPSVREVGEVVAVDGDQHADRQAEPPSGPRRSRVLARSHLCPPCRRAAGAIGVAPAARGASAASGGPPGGDRRAGVSGGLRPAPKQPLPTGPGPPRAVGSPPPAASAARSRPVSPPSSTRGGWVMFSTQKPDVGSASSGSPAVARWRHRGRRRRGASRLRSSRPGRRAPPPAAAGCARGGRRSRGARPRQ